MSFEADVRRAANKLNTSVEKVGSRVVREWFDGTVELTPVDTGRLQGNWQVSKVSPKLGEIARRGTGGPLADIKRVVVKPDVYWLVNNLPYAPVVEYGRFGRGPYTTEKTAGTGYSIQAPRGMARVNLIRTKANLRRFARQ